jgi:hypothetical protein
MLNEQLAAAFVEAQSVVLSSTATDEEIRTAIRKMKDVEGESDQYQTHVMQLKHMLLEINRPRPRLDIPTTDPDGWDYEDEDLEGTEAEGVPWDKTPGAPKLFASETEKRPPAKNKADSALLRLVKAKKEG